MLFPFNQHLAWIGLDELDYYLGRFSASGDLNQSTLALKISSSIFHPRLCSLYGTEIAVIEISHWNLGPSDIGHSEPQTS